MTNWTTLPHENLLAYQVAKELLRLVCAAAPRTRRASLQLRAVKLARPLPHWILRQCQANAPLMPLTQQARLRGARTRCSPA